MGRRRVAQPGVYQSPPLPSPPNGEALPDRKELEQLATDGSINPEAFAIRTEEAGRLRGAIQRLPHNTVLFWCCVTWRGSPTKKWPRSQGYVLEQYEFVCIAPGCLSGNN
jgi:hypothetical protein